MQSSPKAHAQARQVSPDKQGLEQEQPEGNHSREASSDIDRVAPCEQRTGRRGDHRHHQRDRDGCPDQN
jgi:hypothetical protein